MSSQEPIWGDAFFGRTEILEELTKRIAALEEGYRQNVALLGPEHVGKSSLILHLLSRVQGRCVIPLYWEVRHEPFARFAERSLLSLVNFFLAGKPRDAEPGLDARIQILSRRLPRTGEICETIRKEARMGRNDAAFERLLELPALLSMETRLPCVLVLDEFDRLNGLDLREPFSALGRKIVVQKRTLTLLLSSNACAARRILSEKLRLLFGNFESLELSGFDYATSQKYLSARLAPAALSPEAADFIIGFTDGLPLYLDVIATHLAAHGHGRSVLGRAEVQEALEELLFDAKGWLHRLFQERMTEVSGSEKLLVEEAILGLAQECRKLSALARIVGARAPAVREILATLVEKGILSQSGVFYWLPDRVFKFWLNRVYRPRRQGLLQNLSETRARFSKELSDYIESFIHGTNGKLGERVAELLRSFSNDRVVLDQRAVLLPRFEAVEGAEGEKGLTFSGRGSHPWLVHVTPGRAGEPEVAEFIERCKKARKAPHRRILVALKGMDENARLLAKQKRVWGWGLSDLNFIMDLYNQPVVLRPPKEGAG